jgi:hypothetical protein
VNIMGEPQGGVTVENEGALSLGCCLGKEPGERAMEAPISDPSWTGTAQSEPVSHPTLGIRLLSAPFCRQGN